MKNYIGEILISVIETLVCIWVESQYGMAAGLIAGGIALLVLGMCHFWFFEPRYKLSLKEDERARREALDAYKEARGNGR